MSYEDKALRRAEDIGVMEYRVNGRYMEYWTFFGKYEGWYFIRHDLDSGKDVFRGARIPWDFDADNPIPAFLRSPTPGGGLLYNYMAG